MLTKYIRAAMARAAYEIVEDDGSFYGHIPGIDGVWANAPTLEACREELEEVLQEWLMLNTPAIHRSRRWMGSVWKSVKSPDASAWAYEA